MPTPTIHAPHRLTGPAATSWHLGRARVTQLPLDALTEADQRVLATIESAERKLDWCAGRLAARRAVARLVAPADPRHLEIRAGPDGAPLAPVSLSISHRDGRGLALAMRGDGPFGIGIDLERRDAIPPSRARYFLTARERCLPCSLARLWTLKEAAWKALGCTADVPFTALELRADHAGRLHAVALHGQVRPAAFRLGRPWPGYLSAAVVLAPEERA